MSEELSELGRRLSQARRRVTAYCEVCGKEIPNATSRRRYCGPAHKLIGYRRERRQERAQAAQHAEGTHHEGVATTGESGATSEDTSGRG